jgi:4-oxalocrotonate tautomerase
MSATSNTGNKCEERRMPHVIVKLWPGKSEQQKTRLAEAITKDVTSILHYGEESVSVAMEEVEPEEWVEKVYKPEIKKNLDKLYKKPGYDEEDL